MEAAFQQRMRAQATNGVSQHIRNQTIMQYTALVFEAKPIVVPLKPHHARGMHKVTSWSQKNTCSKLLSQIALVMQDGCAGFQARHKQVSSNASRKSKSAAMPRLSHSVVAALLHCMICASPPPEPIETTAVVIRAKCLCNFTPRMRPDITTLNGRRDLVAVNPRGCPASHTRKRSQQP